MTDRDRAAHVLTELRTQLDGFVLGLEPLPRSEFEGLHSVLRDYVFQDLGDGSVDHGLLSLVVGAISQEMDRLTAIGFPFTQELCARTARGFEELGGIYDAVHARLSDPTARDAALVSYELAVVWYRVVKTAYTGVLPVQSQLHIVKALLRLGSLTRSRDIFKRAIRELFFLIDDDKFISLMTLDKKVLLTEPEREGLLTYRQRLRASIRQAMIEAITRLHQAIPEKTRMTYRALEKKIIAFEAGPAELFRFLESVTVIPELRNVKGGRDWLLGHASRPHYMNMGDHAEEVRRALEALENRDYVYFEQRLSPQDRDRVAPDAFVETFRDVFEDYFAFTRHSGVSKINFWFSLLLHDIGKILLQNHHTGGSILVESLLGALGIQGHRRESITDYVRYHGQWKRFYLLENSPQEVLEYVHRVGPANLPFMLLEKRRIESIVDLASTGEGHLTLDFIEESRKYRDVAYLEELTRS